MRHITEYSNPISITEFFSTSNTNKIVSNEEALEQYIIDFAKEAFSEDIKGASIIAEETMKHLNKKYDTYRVYANFKAGNEFILKNDKSIVAQPFSNLIEEDSVLDKVIEDIKENSEYHFETENDEYVVYFSNMAFMLSDYYGDNGIVFEVIDEYVKTVNFEIYKYHSENKNYIEISNRRILNELDNVPYENDVFWENYNMFVDDYKNIAVEKTGVDFYILGSNGKHLCVEPSFQVIHTYDTIVEVINDLQEKFKKDVQDEIDYQNDPENH